MLSSHSDKSGRGRAPATIQCNAVYRLLGKKTALYQLNKKMHANHTDTNVS